MSRFIKLVVISFGSLLLAAAGCAGSGAAGPGRAQAALGSCALGDTYGQLLGSNDFETLTTETVTAAAIPSLSSLARQQIIAAVHESAHTDVTTIEEAFARVDDHVFNRVVVRHLASNQFYLAIEFGAGDNSYGAIFYYGSAVEAAAIHDGFLEECGPLVLQTPDLDYAPACAGFLDYTNSASFTALDAYLPSNVAQAIVATRTSTPFASIASVLAVNGVGEVRLQQILAAARTAGSVGASCDGIYDAIGVSVDQSAAIVGFVNQASRNELAGVLSFLINQTVVDTLLANRPFATVGAISATAGVGSATFRALRNAATSRRPFEELVDAVNGLDHPDGQIRLSQHFDWMHLVTAADGFASMTCFGVNPSLLPPRATLRPGLADGAEVQTSISEAVSIANRFHELTINPALGLADLQGRTQGHTFFGCYIQYRPNPFQYDNQAFFIDTQTGAGILNTLHYVE